MKSNQITVTLLLEIKAELRELRQRVEMNTELLADSSSSNIGSNEHDTTFQLPLKTESELQSLEEQLSQDKTATTHLVNVYPFY